jgi:hypothetical protein
MRIPTAFLSILLAGCASANHPGSQTGPSSSAQTGTESIEVASRRDVDTLPRLLVCSSVSNFGGGSGGYLTVPVRLTVTPEGRVAPGSIHAVGRIGFRATQPNVGIQEENRLMAKAGAARSWAERSAATCTFEPAKRDGQPVAMEIERWFYYAD